VNHLVITANMSACTGKEQLTLHMDNCMGCPFFHKWKFKWKVFEITRDITCSLYSFVVWHVTWRWHDLREITCEIQNVSDEFSLTKSLESDTSFVKSLVKFRIFPMSFHLLKYW